MLQPCLVCKIFPSLLQYQLPLCRAKLPVEQCGGTLDRIAASPQQPARVPKGRTGFLGLESSRSNHITQHLYPLTKPHRALVPSALNSCVQLGCSAGVPADWQSTDTTFPPSDLPGVRRTGRTSCLLLEWWLGRLCHGWGLQDPCEAARGRGGTTLHTHSSFPFLAAVCSVPLAGYLRKKGSWDSLCK